MQTFLPYPSFSQSAAVLDRQRLGKQRVENIQLIRGLFKGEDYGWAHHPALLMWVGYEGALLQYHIAICNEWHLIRGYKDTTYSTAFQMFADEYVSPQQYDPPPWLGDEDFHRAHQSNLLRKAPAHYNVYFPGVPDDLPYIWPVKMEDFE